MIIPILLSLSVRGKKTVFNVGFDELFEILLHPFIDIVHSKATTVDSKENYFIGMVKPKVEIIKRLFIIRINCGS